MVAIYNKCVKEGYGAGCKLNKNEKKTGLNSSAGPFQANSHEIIKAAVELSCT